MERYLFHGYSICIGSRELYREALVQACATLPTTQVITMNPEYVVLGKTTPALAALTAAPTLTIPDGIGLVWSVGRGTERYPGSDAAMDILNYAHVNALRVGILLRTGGLSRPAQIDASLHQRFPQLQVQIAEETPEGVRTLRAYNPHILFVTFGQPRQDVWIAEHRLEFPNTRLAMGVGGTFDFTTGMQKRAPRFFQAMGLEWFWRLLHQPTRLPRMFRATFGFWYTLLTS